MGVDGQAWCAGLFDSPEVTRVMTGSSAFRSAFYYCQRNFRTLNTVLSLVAPRLRHPGLAGSLMAVFGPRLAVAVALLCLCSFANGHPEYLSRNAGVRPEGCSCRASTGPPPAGYHPGPACASVRAPYAAAIALAKSSLILIGLS